MRSYAGSRLRCLRDTATKGAIGRKRITGSVEERPI